MSFGPPGTGECLGKPFNRVAPLAAPEHPDRAPLRGSLQQQIRRIIQGVRPGIERPEIRRAAAARPGNTREQAQSRPNQALAIALRNDIGTIRRKQAGSIDNRALWRDQRFRVPGVRTRALTHSILIHVLGANRQTDATEVHA